MYVAGIRGLYTCHIVPTCLNGCQMGEDVLSYERVALVSVVSREEGSAVGAAQKESADVR